MIHIMFINMCVLTPLSSAIAGSNKDSYDVRKYEYWLPYICSAIAGALMIHMMLINTSTDSFFSAIAGVIKIHVVFINTNHEYWLVYVYVLCNRRGPIKLPKAFVNTSTVYSVQKEKDLLQKSLYVTVSSSSNFGFAQKKLWQYSKNRT